jgi:AraC family transcriptional regulator, regulatory protein of adaptative response / DNA-3-methyladenine glycosylase II
MFDDFEGCYRAVQSKDARFDGWFVTAVTSTGIYCRPSCPALTPRRPNVRFYATAAAAQEAGFRACRRCRPDASPGSPQWNARADLVARAMRSIADGVVDREGVAGLARRLGFSERHLHRQLRAEVGAGPRALARAQRAHTARLLIETTDLTFTEVAFAAGFASLRQFNDTVREVFAANPTELRRTSHRGRNGSMGSVALKLPVRPPFDGAALLGFLGARAVVGLEELVDGTYRRALRLPRGTGVVELTAARDHVRCVLFLDDLRDLSTAVQRCRRLLDLDSDPVAVDGHLGADPDLGAIVRARPGRRVPGTVDGSELALRAVLGQQISVAGARTLAARLLDRYGQPLTVSRGTVTRAWPDAGALADGQGDGLGMPAARKRAVAALARAVSDGDVVLDPGADRGEAMRRLRSLPGIGPWTASYVAMRALSDPDAFLATDLGARRAVERLGHATDERTMRALSERWRPWRSYALQYLWSTLEVERSRSRPHSPTPRRKR